MRIGLDTTQINLRDGSSRYTAEVLKNLCEFFPEEQFVAFGPNSDTELNFPNLTRVYIPEVVGLRRRLEYSLTISKQIKKNRIDLFHNLANHGFLFKPCPMVTTIQDIATLKFSSVRNRRIDWYLYKYVVPFLLNTSDSIVASSYNTAEDLNKHYNLAPKVSVVHLGYNRALFNLDPIEKKMDLPSKFIFFVGHIIPKKNLTIIFRALAELKERNIAVPFLIAGRRGYGAREIFAQAKQLGVSDLIEELGLVTDEELKYLYQKSTLLVYPSVYEGFGLPPLESLACGTPCLVSDTSSLKEVIPDCGLRCKYDDPTEWARKIEAIITNPKERMKVRNWGLNHCRKFSWESCVNQLMSIYQLLVSK